MFLCRTLPVSFHLTTLKRNENATVTLKTSFPEMKMLRYTLNGPRQANLLLIAYASSEGSGEPAHPRSLARTFAARSYKQWVKRNLQTENQIPGPSEWLGMRSWNLSWRNARRHKFACRGPIKISLWFYQMPSIWHVFIDAGVNEYGIPRILNRKL